MDCSTLGFPALQDLPEFAQTHFHWVDDAIQPSHTLLPTSLAFNLSQHQLLFGCSAVSDSLWPRGLQTNRLLCPWNSPGKNTGVGCHFILQGIFGTQGLNPCVLCVLHWQADYLPTEPPGSPAWGSFPMSQLFTIRWSKYWSFSFRISLSNEYSGLISFRSDWFDLLTVQGTFRSLL